MKRMRLYVIAMLLAVLSLFAGEGVGSAQAKPWVTAYVGGWWFNSDNNGAMPIQNINFKGMTVCDHMGLLPLANAPFIDTAVVNGWVTNSMFVANSLILTAAAHAAGVKCTFTIGAWSTESAFMSATTPANLPSFVKSLVAFLKYRGYDGVDVDWEPLSPSDTVQYKNFIIALRQALPSPYLISVTCGWGSPYKVFASIQKYVDQINIMTYDLSWNSSGYNTWYAGAVYSDSVVDPYDNKTPAVSCNYLVGLYEAAGVAPGKLGIGAEAGGMLWKGCTGANQSISTVTSVTPDVSYNTIMSKYYKPNLYHWDAGAEAAYLSYDTAGTANDWFLTYDDSTSLKAKLAYTQKAGIGGVIIYEIGMSYNQATGTNPFLQASEEYLRGTNSTTDNTPPVVSISSPSNGSSVSGVVTVTAAASDNVGVAGVQFDVDGKAACGMLSAAPYLFALNTDSLSNGPHLVSATAYDAAGNKATAYDTLNVSNTVPAAKPAAVLTLYSDSLSTPWINASYGATVNFANTSPVFSGSRSIKVVSKPWGGLYLHDGNWGSSSYLDCTGYDSLIFHIYPSTSTDFEVFFSNDAGQKFVSASTGKVVPGRWDRVSIPVDRLNPNKYPVQYLGIMANSGGRQTYYVDDIMMKDSAKQAAPQTFVDVYSDSLGSSWTNASWGAGVNFQNTSPVFSGSRSIKVSAGSWGALSLTYGTSGSVGFSAAGYDSIGFDIFSNTSCQLAVLLEGSSGGSFKDVYISVPTKTWQHMKVAVSDIDPTGVNFNRIDIINAGSKVDTFFVDNLQIDSTSAAGKSQKAVTDVSKNGTEMPATFALAQNYPNPFNPSTTIQFALPSAQHAVLRVYDVLGERVATLFDGYAAAGVHSVIWSPKDLSSGVYLYRLQLKERSLTLTGRMLYLK